MEREIQKALQIIRHCSANNKIRLRNANNFATISWDKCPLRGFGRSEFAGMCIDGIKTTISGIYSFFFLPMEYLFEMEEVHPILHDDEMSWTAHPRGIDQRDNKMERNNNQNKHNEKQHKERKEIS